MGTLPNEISSLTDAEKFELLDALWEDLESHASKLSSEQADELDRRIAAYEANRPVGTPWEQVKAKGANRNPTMPYRKIGTEDLGA